MVWSGGWVEPNRLTDEVMRPWWRRRPQHNEADDDGDGNANGRLGFVVWGRGGTLRRDVLTDESIEAWWYHQGIEAWYHQGLARPVQRIEGSFDEWGDKESLVSKPQQGGRTKDLFLLVFLNPSHGSKKKCSEGCFLGELIERRFSFGLIEIPQF